MLRRCKTMLRQCKRCGQVVSCSLRRVEKRPLRRPPYDDGVGWGVPIAGEPTVRRWGFVDRRPRTHRRRRSGTAAGPFYSFVCHAAQRSRRHDLSAPLCYMSFRKATSSTPAQRQINEKLRDWPAGRRHRSDKRRSPHSRLRCATFRPNVAVRLSNWHARFNASGCAPPV